MRIRIALLLLLCFSAGLCEDDDRRKIYLYLEGRAVFEEMCAQCHGKYGKGDGEWAEGWTENRPRNFREGIYKFRTTPMGKLPTDDDLRRTIRNGISGTAMPAFHGHLRDSQYEAVIEYLKHLSKKWKKPENVGKSIEIPEQSEAARTAEGKKQLENRGGELFSQHCASCHGVKGRGDGEAGKALMDVWGFAIKPADLSREHYKSGDRYEDVYRTVAMGLDGTPMVGFHPVLKKEDIEALVVFTFSLRE